MRDDLAAPAFTEPGFADPVHDAQAVFRTLLTAMSEPGRVLRLPTDLPAQQALLLTLADAATPVWLDPAAQSWASWLVFHTGARLVGSPADAAFAVAATCPRLNLLDRGTDADPDRSATLILEVDQLSEAGDLRLTGPGIPTERRLTASLPAWFRAQWEANRTCFPAGIDVILTCGARLAGLPRTTTVEPACMSR